MIAGLINPTTDAPERAHPLLVAMVVSLATFMEVLDTTITNVSLSHIAGSLAASQDESTWVLTSYLVANGIVLPLSGWLSEVMGRKNFFMVCIAGFTVASFACGIASSLPMLIVFRLLQGLAGGGLQPTQQAIIMDSFSAEKRGTAFAITGVTMIVAPILGPTLGGFITDNFNWRWIFFMNIPVGLIAFILVGRLVVDPPHAKAKGVPSIDYIGLGLVALGLGTLQILLDKGQEEDWFGSNFIITLAIISAFSLAAATLWLLRQKDPIIDLRLLANRSFGLASLMIFFVGFALYGGSTLLPLLVQSDFGYDATLAGLVLSPGGFAVIILMPFMGKLVNRVYARYLVSFGMLSLACGMFYTMRLTPDMDYPHFVLARILQVVGLPFLFVSISTMAFSTIAKEKSSKASALYSLMRNLGGSAGISLLLSYLVRHEQMHQVILSGDLTPTNMNYQALVAGSSRALEGLGHTQAVAHHLAEGHIYRELLRQSSVLGYSDTFQIIAIIVLVLAVIALGMPANKLHRKPVAGAGGTH